MIIRQKHNPKRLGSLVVGDCFYYEGNYYIKTNLYDEGDSITINIDTGNARTISVMQQVIKVNAEVTVSHEP